MCKKSTLVLGVGNFILSDEGVGVHVAHQLQNMPIAFDVEVIDGGTGGFELITHFEGRKKVIIVDAMRTDDKPGTVYRFTLEDIAHHRQNSFSAHQFNLHELLHFVQQMRPRPEVVIYGLVPQESKLFSTKLSEVVSRGIRRMLPVLIEEIRQTNKSS